jgi:hypothetical protein
VTQAGPAAETEAEAPTGILWIASYPKSGNTWTRAFLNNLLKITRGEDEGAPQDINRMSEFTIWDVAAAPYEQYLGKPAREAERAEIARVRPLVQAQIAERTEGLALVKTHHALVQDRGFPAINFQVTSGAIYVVRNPLDVAVSFAAHLGSSLDTAIEQMATRDLETSVSDNSVYEIYGSWSQHVESWTRKPHSAIHVMRYEDMLAEPRAVFEGLARHLLLPATAGQIDEALSRSSFAEMRRQEDEAGYREKPDAATRFFRTGKAGGWRQALEPRQVRRIIQAHHEQMARFGYLTDDLRLLM